MSELEYALDECMARLARGEVSVDECLRAYPKHAEELRQLVAAAAALEAGRAVQPTPVFTSQTKTLLRAYMRAQPRRRPSSLPIAAPPSRPRTQFRVAFASFMLGLLLPAAITALAQAALPTQPLYGWKLASEQAWRAVQADRLAADLALAERRAQELLLVAGDPVAERVARQEYVEALVVLAGYDDPASQARILEKLAGEQADLAQAGIGIPELDEAVGILTSIVPTGGSGAPLPLATGTALPTAHVSPTSILPTPIVVSTLPPLVPTLTLPPLTATGIPGSQVPAVPTVAPVVPATEGATGVPPVPTEAPPLPSPVPVPTELPTEAPTVPPVLPTLVPPTLVLTVTIVLPTLLPSLP